MPKRANENPPPKIIESTIAELNQLAGGKREQVVAAFNKIPPGERTRVNLEEIIDKTDRRIVVAIVRAWYPEKTKSYPEENIPEGIAYNFLKRIVMANPDNFFARINGQTESISATGEMDVLTAHNIKTVRKGTLRGCLHLLNPLNWT